MSQDINESHSVPVTLPDAPAKQSVKSFKKKFAKLKIKFELETRESDELIREELRIEELSKRIQTQNDQLLETLLEFNDNLHLSPDLRFDLSAPEDPPSLLTSERDVPAFNDTDYATSALNNAKSEMAAGKITTNDYYNVEDTVRRSRAFPPGRQYTSLLKVPHTAPQSEEQHKTEGRHLEDIMGFLSSEHETEYYLAMDARLGDESAAEQLSHVPEKSTSMEREREVAIRNPVSVYNWLRRKEPQILHQDDNTSEKSASRPSNQRSSKKAAQTRKEEEDDDTVSMDAGPTSTSKNKRKRDDDSAYRPKGGSSRSRKKKDDGNRRASKRAAGTGTST